MTIILNGLVIEDNEYTLTELIETLPSTLEDYEILWTPCKNFDEATMRLMTQRFDIVITDIYIDSEGHAKSYDFNETGAKNTIDSIRKHRFCPVLAITDGSKPDHFPDSPFVGFADKTNINGVEDALKTLIATGIPKLSRSLHDELDKDASFYLWRFLEENWDKIRHEDTIMLERLLKRRAAIVLSRLDHRHQSEIGSVEGLEFYIYPPISKDAYRLGELIRNKESQEFSIILTPHCHLTIQAGANEPRAEFVLTVKTRKAHDLIRAIPIETKKEDKRQDELRRRIQGPAQFNGKPEENFSKSFKPDGRYFFLPGFLQIPDLYCDFLQVESIEYASLRENYERIAVLDTPFAESLQVCFTGFYSAIGTPNLDPSRFVHLISD